MRTWVAIHCERLPMLVEWKSIEFDVPLKGALLSLMLVADRSESKLCGYIYDEIGDYGLPIPLSVNRLAQATRIARRSLPQYLRRLVKAGFIRDHGEAGAHVIEIQGFIKYICPHERTTA